MDSIILMLLYSFHYDSALVKALLAQCEGDQLLLSRAVNFIQVACRKDNHTSGNQAALSVGGAASLGLFPFGVFKKLTYSIRVVSTSIFTCSEHCLTVVGISSLRLCASLINVCTMSGHVRLVRQCRQHCDALHAQMVTGSVGFSFLFASVITTRSRLIVQ
jgi:hypothetical protein